MSIALRLRSSWLHAAIAAASLLPPLARALAQPDAAPAPATIPIEAALSAVRDAYHSRPFAERVTISVRRLPAPGVAPEPGRAERREEVLLRIDPGHGLNRTGVRLWLQLGDLRIAAGTTAADGGGRLVAVHARDPESYVESAYRAPLTPAALASLLPPLPLPQIDLALGDADPPTRLTPYLDGITWEKVTVDESAPRPTMIITGRAGVSGRTGVGGRGGGSGGGGGRLEIIADTDGRIREFTAELGQASAGSTPSQLRVVCTRLDLDPAAVWEIPTEGRRRVADLTQLHARPGDIAAGQPIPGFPLTHPDGRAWSLAEDLSPLMPDDPLAPRPCLVVLLVRVPRDSAESPAATPRPTDSGLAPAISAITELVRETTAPPVARPAGPPTYPRCAARSALIFDLPTRDLSTRVKNAADTEANGGWGKTVLWSASPATTIDRLAPAGGVAEGGAIIAIIDADRILRAVIPVAGDAASDRIRTDLEQALATKPAIGQP